MTTECVCGHPRSEHTGMSGPQRYCKHYYGDCGVSMCCQCQDFRAVLPWPDAEGFWWMLTPHREATIAEFTCDGELWLIGGDYTFSSSEQLARNSSGPARFTKLLEPNPFERQA